MMTLQGCGMVKWTQGLLDSCLSGRAATKGQAALMQQLSMMASLNYDASDRRKATPALIQYSWGRVDGMSSAIT
jgi:hypothetical protein